MHRLRFSRATIVRALRDPILAACLLCACDPGEDVAKERYDAQTVHASGSDAAAPRVDGSAPVRNPFADGGTSAAPQSTSDATSHVASDAGTEEPKERPSTDASVADGRATLQPETHGSFESALRVEVDAPAMIVDELSAEQVDYYVFHAQAGTFYEITTDADRYSPDNVIALFDGERQMIAQNDTGSRWPGDAFDARIVVRAPKTGDYYVRVEDEHTPPEYFGGRFSLLFYRLGVRAISASTPGYALPGVEPVFHEQAELGYRYVTVLGEFDESSEVISFAGANDTALIARVHAGGKSGDGSSVREGRATVTAQDGAILAAIDRDEGREHIRPPVAAGDYRLTLELSGERGDNPFYAVDLVLLEDNPLERNDSENGRAPGAEVITLSAGSAGRALLRSRLAPGDVDYFRVRAEEQQDISIGCEGESTGSGVRGLLVELRDAADRVIISGKEGFEGIDLTYRVSNSATYYVRLSSAAGEAEPVEPWVRCGLIVS